MTAAIGTASKIPQTPKSPPPTMILSSTQNGERPMRSLMTYGSIK